MTAPRSERPPRWALPVAFGLIAAPLALAVAAQRDARWHPVFDLAMTELRVRDVGGPDTPLIGLQGRIGPTGSHPGPLSFYLLAPVYRLAGSSAFALQVATAAFHLLAVAAALVMARRRPHPWAVPAVGIVLLLLVLGLGLGPLTQPWNPHLPVLWFVAFLVAVWGVLDGDLVLLVPAVAVASLCAQTHVPYLAVTAGIGGAVVVLAAGGELVRARREGSTVRARWFVVAGVVGLALWIPPLIDEVTNEPGNLSQIADHLGTPEESPIGLTAAKDLVLERLDVWHLATVVPRHPGTFVHLLSGPGPESARGAVALAAWAGCVVWAVVDRHRRLLALHVVVVVAAAVGLVAMSRIHGVPWSYLLLWGFGIGGLMLLSIGATVAVVAGRRWPALRRERWRAAAGFGLVVLAVGLSIRLLTLAPDATTETPAETEQLGRLVGPTVAALEAGEGAATGQDGRYQVLWYDATLGGSEGIGMVNELIRRGFDVGVDHRDRVRIGPHRVIGPDEATARVVVASGGWIAEVAADPDAVRIAFDDPSRPGERAEFEETRDRAAALLVETGRSDLVPLLDRDLFHLALNEPVDPTVRPLLARLLDIGVPVAVFVLPGGCS